MIIFPAAVYLVYTFTHKIVYICLTVCCLKMNEKWSLKLLRLLRGWPGLGHPWRETYSLPTSAVASSFIFCALGFQLGQGVRASSFLVCCRKGSPLTLVGFNVFIIELTERFQS